MNPSVIAIVDDDALVRRALSRLVKSIGYRAKVFESAEDFLQGMQKHEIACVICDVQLPRMNGLELQRRLNMEKAAPAFILMTAHPNDALRDQALAAGATCFLSKPLDSAGLEQWLAKAAKANAR